MFKNIPPVTQALLWSNVIVFLLQQVAGGMFRGFELWPLVSGMAMESNFLPWQLVTYAFLHGSFGHLFFNMLALFMFGAPLEYTWGNRRFATFYFVCVVGAGITHLVVTALLGLPGLPTVGASGGVYGLLLAYGMLFPRQRVMLLFPPIPMEARTLVIVFGALAFLMGITGAGGNIAHFAHLGGMLFGWLLIRYWRGQPPFRPRGPRRFH
ncbi:rhomboid family intramembrane serine protease [Coralloluteibacterium stylophorae]|uniref:Rhomboid family intramembrane serine protease n=1 Tax=Coralloluteibacterium stylophorae TaxID=1776034 RepID=A0A8J8B182_9GAMM|nr:rhomboid family intramembrane serine protease [Coralloluteibacterium stylophorae]MBS7456202.1 rhomboid family intramembrane serine protease [Coralloluteibacterium stylophorae]